MKNVNMQGDVRKGIASAAVPLDMVGANMSFAAKEAYKLLRTNLSYMLTEDSGKCNIIGVTSSLRGEGKSTTSVNLGYVLAEMDKKVLIVDGDLRIPTLHKKLKRKTRTGLSDVLAGKATYAAACQHIESVAEDGTKVTFDILPAGEIPPNPSELIASARMKSLINSLAARYDYIILDLPPVTAVTDALIAAKFVDGLIIVVRNNHTDYHSLNETLRQIRLVNGRILGFVMTCASLMSGGLGKKYKYKYRYNYSESNRVK